MKHLLEGLIKQRGVVHVNSISRDDLNEYNICETKSGNYYLVIKSKKNLKPTGLTTYTSGVLYNINLSTIIIKHYDKFLRDINNPNNNIVNIWKPDDWMIRQMDGWENRVEFLSNLDNDELERLIKGKHYTKIS